MNRIHKKRLTLLSLLLCGFGLAMALILFALKQNINVFLTPSDIATKKLNSDYQFRLGGMVKVGSVERNAQTLDLKFIVTDLKNEVGVTFRGIVPDLFRAGKGVIATGHMNQQGVFVAHEILAKHDENYMPQYKANQIKGQTPT